ncbi:MAG: CRISPR system precrRNA processing endoribonuclease RAMP protein Cas6 [Promethearchaeota archaeon]
MDSVVASSEDPLRFFAKPRPALKFEFRFLTPTTFRTLAHEHDLRLPVPKTLFSNLVHTWNQFFSSIRRVDELSFLRWVEERVMLSNFKLETKKAEIGKPVPFVGFTGWARFLIRVKGPAGTNSEILERCRLIDYLGRMASITNVGHNRTAGLGSVGFKVLEVARVEGGSSDKQ